MPKEKRTIVKPRRVEPELPEIFVKVGNGWRSTYAKAAIRVKSGKYLYLQWRDGGRVLSFYLGRKRNA